MYEFLVSRYLLDVPITLNGADKESRVTLPLMITAWNGRTLEIAYQGKKDESFWPTLRERIKKLEGMTTDEV